jgi:hypothetical protein
MRNLLIFKDTSQWVWHEYRHRYRQVVLHTPADSAHPERRANPNTTASLAPSGRSHVGAATAEVREAIDLLGRVSTDWRNGNPSAPGPVHWSAAVPAAREALSRALLILEEIDSQQALPATPADPPTTDDDRDVAIGMAVYNGWTRAERLHWHQVAGSARPVDAYRAYCDGGPAP